MKTNPMVVYPRARAQWIPLAALLSLIACQISVAQVVAPASGDETGKPKKEDEEALVLSPFTVTSEKDTGYQATNTLAGTRLNTPLKDIAASISVLTKDLFEDTASTRQADLLVYATSTEIAGVGGNYSGNADNSTGERRRAIPVNRIRGLAEADNTRNYFYTGIPMDAYNTESVTINRGANAILFGLGSPAGIIETTTIKPQFKNSNRVQLRTDQYGSNRESLDIERVLLNNKLSFRVAGLHENQKYEQEEAFLKQKRAFGTLTYRPFKDSTFRISLEHGNNIQRLPRTNPPLNYMGVYWDYNKVFRADNIWTPPFGVSDGAEEQFQRLNALDGAFGPFFYNTGAFFAQNGGGITDAFPSFSDYNAPNSANTVQYRFLGLRDPVGNLFYSTRDPSIAGSPLNAFNHNPQILDRSIFDYRKHMIDGANSHTSQKFRALNLSFEQLFLNGDAGFELAYDRQHVANEWEDASPWAVSLDVNKQTIDGRVNPNFGRPYVALNPGAHRDIDDSVNARATTFIKHDFSAQMGWLGRILGRQQATGFYTDWNRKNTSMNAISGVIDQAYYIGSSNNLGSRNLAPVIYLGNSLANASSAAGSNLGPVQGEISYPDTITVRALRGATWQTESYKVYEYPDWEHTASSVSKTRSNVISYGAVWQGNWFDETLVSTIGWRHDEVDNYNGNNNSLYNPATGARYINDPHVVLSQSAKSNLTSRGYALRLPKPWRDHLPWGLDFTLYHNVSENFRVTGFRNDLYGNPINPQSGSTKDIGFGVSVLNNKVSFRVTKFTTEQNNESDGRINGILQNVAIMEQRIYETNTEADLAAAGYVGFKSANVGPLYSKYIAAWKITDAGPHSNGYGRNITFVAPLGVNETTSSISKGWEYEAVINPTANWRLLLNASEATAARGTAGTALGALIDERKTVWFQDSLKDRPGGQNFTIGSFAQQTMINVLNTARLSEGQLNPELRKWRANFVTNYEFSRTSALKGWNVGGAVRWQDKIAIGYAVVNNPVLGIVSDPTKPFYGPSETTVDLMIGYHRPLFHNKLDWKIQLNVRNLLNDDLLIPLQSNAVAVGETQKFTVGTYRMGEERSFVLTQTFAW
jgi:outer membrane receptor protein involved in Fe transport